MSKKVCILTGIGFGDQRELILTMKNSLGWQVEVFEMGASLAPEIVAPSLKTAELIILRSPWTPTFEEAIYDEYIALKLQFVFEELKIRIARGDTMKVLGIGRGAHVLLKSNHPALSVMRDSEWERITVESASWTPIKINGLNGNFMGQLFGGYLPKISVEDQGTLQPWMLLADGQIAGWNVSDQFYLSWVDPLAYQHPSQLSDYGYLDYTQISKCEDFLQQFSTERIVRS